MAGPLSGNVTWAGGGALNVAGSMTVAATGITRTYTGGITFSATTTGKTLTIGQSLGGLITFNGAGGGWTLGSALSSTSSITITAGTFDTSAASNYALTCSQLLCASASTCALNLNASTVTITSFSASTFTGTGFTLNAGTSQINFTSTASPSLTSSGRTFYNVAFTGAGSSSITATISGANTFNNLSFTSPSISTVQTAIFSANQTVNGALSASGVTQIRRVFLRSDTLGTTRTLTLANPTTLSNVDIRDITAATNAITATSSGGDCGGNTNITFSTPKTVYWNLAGVQNWSATAWATSSGGIPAAANFPLAQDTAIFNNAGAAGTVNGGSFAAWNIGTVDMSARTSAMTLSFSTSPTGVYGSWKNGTGLTVTGSVTLTFSGRGNTQEILGNGVTISHLITVQNIGGTVRLADAVTIPSTATFNLAGGTLDLQSYTLTVGLFNSSNSNTRTIAFGTGNITVNGSNATLWTTATVTGLTVTGTPVVNVSNNSAGTATISSGSPTEVNSISFNFTTGTYALANTAGAKRNINFTGFAGTISSTLQTVYGDVNFGSTIGLFSGGQAWTFASTSATPRTITTNGMTIEIPLTFDGVGGKWVLQDALTVGSTRAVNHTNGTLDLNGKTFTAGATYNVNAGTKDLTFNGGTILLVGTGTVWSNTAPTNFTTTAGTGTGTISLTAATAKTFAGGGSTYNCTLNQGGLGTLTITGANTFNNITNTVQPATVTFQSSTTTTFLSGFNLNGTAGNLVTINSSTSGAQATLSKASGIVSVNYCSIQDSNATGGAAWYAGANSTNVSNNTGWIFTAPPSPSGNTGAFFSIL